MYRIHMATLAVPIRGMYGGVPAKPSLGCASACFCYQKTVLIRDIFFASILPIEPLAELGRLKSAGIEMLLCNSGLFRFEL